MTRVCMDCGKTLGEKCPNCGMALVDTRGSNFSICRDCGQVSRRGDGGKTHGFCGGCLAARERELTAAGA